jgi:tetratricopeptide (TPR) repeat protein
MRGTPNRFTTFPYLDRIRASLLLGMVAAFLCGCLPNVTCSSGAPDYRIALCTSQLNMLDQQPTAAGGNAEAGRQANMSLFLVERARAYRDKGDKEHASADFDRALAAADEAIRLGLGNEFLSVMFVKRALVHAYLEDHRGALADLEQAIQHGAPMDFNYYNIRGHEYAVTGEYDRAIADHDQAIGIVGPAASEPIIFYRGALYAAKGDYDLAIADENQALQMSPKADTRAVRGAAYRAKGDYEHAIIDLSDRSALKIFNSPRSCLSSAPTPIRGPAAMQRQ